MNRKFLVDVAQSQLEAARDSRRRAIRCAMAGDHQHAALWFGSARLYYKAARLFMRDAHTEHYDRLKLRKARR